MLGEMNGSNLRQTVLSFLDRQTVMTLATQGPEGVWAAAVYYANDKFTFYFLSSPESRHSRDLIANPVVSAAIHEDSADWRNIRGVQLEGRASSIRGVERASAIARYAIKFPLVRDLAQAPVEITEAFARMAWFKLETVRLFFIDNSLGLGHRDEIQV